MKRLILVLTLAAIVLAAAGGSIAYFTVAATAHNVITAGNVRMALHDEAADGGVFSDKALNGMMPGDTADKIVYVENTGDNTFYTRIKVVCNAKSPEGKALSAQVIAFDIDTASWQMGSDGWYYCLSGVDKGTRTKPLFTKVSFLPGVGNDYTDANVSISIDAQAVQRDNNGTTVWQAAGWPAG